MVRTLALFLIFMIVGCTSDKPTKIYRTIAQDSDLQVIDPLRDIEKIEVTYQIESIVRLKNAKIIMADYQLLRRDFPELHSMSQAEIDQWLLDQSAFVAKDQLSAVNANTPIEVTGETKVGFRPKDYGRAMVYKTSDDGLLDAKGVGVKGARAGDHSDGLMSLGEGIREYVYEKMVNHIFTNEDPSLKTVGSYAVIDTGFDVRHADGSTSPAGIYLRQAHIRAKGNYSLFNETESLRLEKTLRKYGITSAGAYRDRFNYDKINIQGTKDGAVLDFGGFLTVDKFRKREARHFFGTNTLIKANEVVDPDPELKIPFHIWGTTESGVEDPKNDNIWRWSHNLAKDLRNGSAQREHATTHFYNLMNPIKTLLPLAPGRQSGSCNEIFINLVR